VAIFESKRSTPKLVEQEHGHLVRCVALVSDRENVYAAAITCALLPPYSVQSLAFDAGYLIGPDPQEGVNAVEPD